MASENEVTPTGPDTPASPAPETPPAETPQAEIEALKAGVQAMRAENDTLTDRVLRIAADLENLRRRTTKERTEWADRAVEGVVRDLLPALDAFDRALSSGETGADAATLLEGMRLTRRLLDGALAARGVAPIDATGEPFDPARHEAVTMKPATGDEKAGSVVAVLEKGYRLGDRTVRAMRCVVASAPPEPGNQEN
jgi:molecular chaperone GrpE